MLILASVAVGAFLPSGVDWKNTYRPATLAIVQGQSPYSNSAKGLFYSPPWTAIPLLPLAVLPVWVGRGALFLLTLIIYLAAARRMEADRWGMLLVLLSPIAMHELLNGNVDGLVLLGLFVPPRWGLFFATIKPQVGAGLIVFWAVEAWRERTVIATFAPVTVAGLLSLAAYGLWPLHATHTSVYWFNASLFPYSLPLAVALLAVAMRRRDERPALAASPFLAPYALFHSYIGALIALSGHRKSLIAVVGLLWALIIWRLVGSI